MTRRFGLLVGALLICVVVSPKSKSVANSHSKNDHSDEQNNRCEGCTTGRKGSGQGKGGSGTSGDSDEDGPTEPVTATTSEVSVCVMNSKTYLEQLRVQNFSIVPGSRTAAEESPHKPRCEQLQLCTSCKRSVGNSTNDADCARSKEYCWTSQGCYRMTMWDKVSRHYHIEKGCWNEKIDSAYGKCGSECNANRASLPSRPNRVKCFCETCKGQMCNSQILLSTAYPRQSPLNQLYVIVVTLLVGVAPRTYR